MSKRIIIFYSHTGTTKLVVERINEKLKYPIVELSPIVAYSENYRELLHRKISTKTPKIKELKINLDEFEEIILAFPVWWYKPAPVMRAFLKIHNLSGKTIIPLVISSGWAGGVSEDLRRLCPKSTIKNPCYLSFTGLDDNRKFTSTKSAVKRWFEDLK